ncbi:MAG: MFS transporter, partial [Chloroflexota bacterium]|nr:MFS transporter [Chloroflexota bacterium]
YASDRFGLTQLGTIYGAMFAVMPLGSGLGAYLGGVLYDSQGTYAIAIWSNIALLFLATGAVFSIKERRLPGEAPAAAN